MPPRLADPVGPEPSVVRINVVHPEQPTESDPSERRTMVVGIGVTVSGDIRFCDRLVLEGNLEASVHEGRELQISRGGVFRGMRR